MSGPMDPELLAGIRSIVDSHPEEQTATWRGLRDLLTAHDYHSKRADDAETEAAQLLADLAEKTSECKRLRTALATLRGDLIR